MKHKKIISLLLAAALLFSTTGCVKEAKTRDLMEGIQPRTALTYEYTESDIRSPEEAFTDFAVRLLQAENAPDQNTLLSPLSVLYAMSMTANGAKGETLAQMEDILGLPVDSLNAFFYNYMQGLTPTESCKLQLANSVWFTDAPRFTANPDFLQVNADCYEADIFSAPFDSTTLRDINNWVREKTEGRIPEILDKIPVSAVMYLISALAFDGEWSLAYTKKQIRSGTFTKEDGNRQNADFMYSREGQYLEDENTTGFFKYYKGSDYAFVALLPKEGISLDAYIHTLDGSKLHALLSAPQSAVVDAGIPKFKTEYSTDLANTLKEMGITLAFDPTLADLSGIGASSAGNISISRVIHKTYISLDAQGTIAGAATAIEPTDAGAYIPEDIKTVILDRPFVYMLIDCDTNIPFFIGTVTDLT